MLKANLFIVPRAQYDPSALGIRVAADSENVVVALPAVDEAAQAEIEAEGDLVDDPATGKKD